MKTVLDLGSGGDIKLGTGIWHLEWKASYDKCIHSGDCLHDFHSSLRHTG